MSLVRSLLVTLVATALTIPTASAQEPRISLAIKAGANVEQSEDNLMGTTPGVGVAGAARFAERWRGEFELWYPGALEDASGDPIHRDIQFDFTVHRSFGAGRVRPFVLFGFSLTRQEDWFRFCTALRPSTSGVLEPALVSCDEPDVISRTEEVNVGKDGYLLGGGGLEVPIGRHARFVADVRLSLAPVSLILRPAAGVVIGF